MRFFPALLVACLLLAGCQNSYSAPPSVPAASAMPDTVQVAEVFFTPRDTSDNVDSPAVWHGPDGQHWLLATAKEGDVIRVHDAATGAVLRRVGGSGTSLGQLDRPNGVAVVGNLMVVVERNNARLQVFSLPGLEPLGTFGSGRLRRPYGIAAYEAAPGRYVAYVTDNYETPDGQIPPDSALGERVKQFRFSVEDGELRSAHVRTFGDTSGPGVLRKVESLWVDPARRHLLIAEEKEGESQIKVYDLEGNHLPQLGIPARYFPHEAEGIVLYPCADGGGYWITTDQSDVGNTFHVFGREDFAYRGSFQGRVVSNTDGIAVTPRRFGPFERGALYAVHDDGNTAAFAWGDIAEALGLSECAASGQPTGRRMNAPSDTAAPDRQTAFRVRADFDAELNADAGWAGALNENVTARVEKPFRLRFELASAAGAPQERRFRLQHRRNGGAWTDVDAQRFPKPEQEHTLTFEEGSVGAAPGDWRIVQGNPSAVEVAPSEEQPFLRARTGQEPLLGISRHETRWAPTALTATLRLPEGDPSGAGIVFGYTDPENYYRVDLDAAGAIRVSRFAGGEEETVAAMQADVASGQWLDVEIEVEGDEAAVEFEDETFTADLGAAAPISAFGFHVPAGGAADFRAFEIEGEPRTPRVSIVAAGAYEHGAATTDLLAGSGAPYGAGVGISLAEATPLLSEGGVQSEWEWPLVIRRFADGAVTNDEGDTFAFRMAYADGRPVPADAHPVITAAVPPRLLAGTFVETPGRIGPWEAPGGDLYFLMEPAETHNVLMVVKSTDGGATWQEIDGANRPETGDLEGFAADYAEGTIHMVHQTSDAVLYHAFRTSEHLTAPDTWHVRDDTVATPGEPPTQVASATVRPDGSLVAVYGGPAKIRYKIRAPSGAWGDETVVDADRPAATLSGPMTVLSEGGMVHLAYTEIGEAEGVVWYRRIQPDGTLTPREKLASGVGTSEGARGAILPLVFLPETNTVAVVYRRASGRLWARRIEGDGTITAPAQVTDRAVVQNAVDSDQAGADAVAAGGAVHVLFIGESTGHLYHTQSGAAGVWAPATLEVDGIAGQWVRGMPLRRDGGAPGVYGYVYDAGSDGGSGMNWYGEVPLEGS